LQVILKALYNVEKQAADQALDFSLKNNLLNGDDFEQVLHVYATSQTVSLKTDIRLLDKNNLEKAGQIPETSNIEDYEKIINQ
jgi:hypothetical protein